MHLLAKNKKLLILQTLDKSRQWQSLEQSSQCRLCGRVFQGAEVAFVKARRGGSRLACPTPNCTGTPAQWEGRDGEDDADRAWLEWIALLDQLCRPEKPEHPSVRRLRPGEPFPTRFSS